MPDPQRYRIDKLPGIDFVLASEYDDAARERDALREALAALVFCDLRPDFEDGRDIVLRWKGNKADWERARAALGGSDDR